MNEEAAYLCIDLKSFYASVECAERHLDPMTTNLVVADPERSDKTICLAVSPSMKALGVKNRCRVFEIPKGIDYIMAEPRMQKYIDYAAEIYGIYLSHVSPEDIHVYSVDECFIDVTGYRKPYQKSARELALMFMEEIQQKLGIRATAGIGTNLYLCKIALDITAKHAADFIGELNEESYKRTLWDHKPLTDFWRIGSGIAKRLADRGIYTMRDIAHADEDMLYKLFGVDAELLIDHAWGRESTTIRDIKQFRPKSSGLSSGQVLMRDYKFEEARIVMKEMVEAMCLEMVKKGVMTRSVSFYAGYSNSLDVPYSGGTASLPEESNSDTEWIRAVMEVFDAVMDHDLPVRRLGVSCNNVVKDTGIRQLSFFDTQGSGAEREREKKLMETVLSIKERFGSNAVLKGRDLSEGATARERNEQIGGHKRGK
jgi:DNA polymerase V